MDVLDNLLDAVVIIDSKGRIQFVNKQAQNVFGYTMTQVVGRNVKLLMPNPFRKEHDGYIKRYLETGESKIIGKVIKK